jgi:hypothetical protein
MLVDLEKGSHQTFQNYHPQLFKMPLLHSEVINILFINNVAKKYVSTKRLMPNLAFLGVK